MMPRELKRHGYKHKRDNIAAFLLEYDCMPSFVYLDEETWLIKSEFVKFPAQLINNLIPF